MNKETKVIAQKITDRYSMYNGDSVEVTKGIPDNSIGYSIFSPPFSTLYLYSDSIRDMGNCNSDNQFFEHFKFLIDELFRITMPGRNLSFHIANIPLIKERDGVIGLKDLRGDLIWLFSKAGFIYYTEVCIWKDPLIEAIRTKSLKLTHKQIVKDSARCGHGIPDFVVTMKKPGDNPEPVSHSTGLTNFIGEESSKQSGVYNENQSKNTISHNIWRKYASPVWSDIRQSRTLQTKNAKESDDEPHICPLQLDVIERCLELWTNEGDIVFDPFAGIGSTLYSSICMNRKAIGIELKKSYYRQAILNCKLAMTDTKGFFNE